LCEKFRWGKKETIGLYSKEDIELFKGINIKQRLIRFENELIKIKEILENKNINKLLVIMFPNDIQLSDTTLRVPQKLISEFCAQKKIVCLDLLDLFASHKEENILIDIGHPSVYGNNLAARKIHSVLIKENLIP